MTQTINGIEVEVVVIGPEGEALEEGLNERELEAVQALDGSLQASDNFKAQYPQARLARVDSMRALGETEPGRFYLRYQQGEQNLEFWGRLGEKPKLNMKSGTLTAVLKEASGKADATQA